MGISGNEAGLIEREFEDMQGKIEKTERFVYPNLGIEYIKKGDPVWIFTGFKDDEQDGEEKKISALLCAPNRKIAQLMCAATGYETVGLALLTDMLDLLEKQPVDVHDVEKLPELTDKKFEVSQ